MNSEQEAVSRQVNPEPVPTNIKAKPVRRPVVQSASAWRPIRVKSGDKRFHLHYKLQDQAGMVGPFNFNSAGVAVRQEVLDDALFHDCHFEGSGRTWWGARLYEVKGLTLDGCNVYHTGVHPTPPAGYKVEGHGFYVSLISGGHLSVNKTLFRDMQGNGLQIVNRPSESAFPQEYPNPGGRIDIRKTTFSDCCQAEERGSFALAIYNPGQDVGISDSDVVYTKGFPSFSHGGFEYHSRGGILIGDAQDRSQRCGMATISDVSVLQRNPLQPALQVQGVNRLIVDRFYTGWSRLAGARKIVIDEDVGEATLTRISGNVDILIRDAKGKMHMAARNCGTGFLSWTK